MAWEVTDVTASALGSDPAFPLDPGPLSPIDPTTFITPMPRPDLSSMVGDAFQPLGALHAVIDTAHTTIAENSASTRIDAASAQYLDPAGAAHAASSSAFDAIDPSDLTGATQAQHDTIDGNQAPFNEDQPPDTPEPGLPDPPEGAPRPPHGI